MLRDISRPLAHERTNCGGGGVEDIHLVLFAHRPEAIIVWIVWNTFEDQRGRPIKKRSVHDIAVTRDPSDVGGAPVNLARAIVEDVAERCFGPDRVAACRVNDSLGAAGRSRGIENEQWIFCRHGLAGAGGFDVGRQLVIPVIPSLGHRDARTRMAHHQYGLGR